MIPRTYSNPEEPGNKIFVFYPATLCVLCGEEFLNKDVH